MYLYSSEIDWNKNSMDYLKKMILISNFFGNQFMRRIMKNIYEPIRQFI